MQRRDRDKAEVMMGPLIDAVFLLLVFFLVATMLKKEKRDIDITPPESSSAVRMLPDDDMLVLGVNREGDLFWQGVPTSLNELHYRLREVALVDRGRVIRLDTDHETPFVHVVQVLDLAQFNGMTNVGIRTYDSRYNR
ncbi:MAG: biopolymer transporter ExbD [Planctomycetota bacterium]